MASIDYAEIARDTLEAIREAGAPITITHQVPGEYDPAISTVGEPVTKRYTGYAVQSRYRSAEIDGTRIRSGDAKFLIATDGVPRPESNWEITFAGEKWKVVETTPVQPGGVPVIWMVQARR